MKKLIASLLLCFFFTLDCLVLPASQAHTLVQSKIKIKKMELTIEWARSDEERVRGLQGRKFLGENEGMIFDYGTEQILSFWMKDTMIPLSIAFVDRNGKIIEIQDMKPNSLEAHWSTRKARYALELNQGWFRRHHVRPGDRVHFQP